MQAFANFARRVRALLFRAEAERELDNELRFHIDLETEKNVGLGLPPDVARQRARATFGSIDVAKEAYRDGRGTRLIEDFIADVSLALRALRRNPGFAAAAIITLTLGIGANVAIFTAVNAVLVRPLPYRDPGRLVMLWEANVERGWVNQTAAPANMFDWEEQVTAFEDVGGYASFTNDATLTGRGEPQQFATVQVTGNFFRVLGITPAAGRLFGDEETWSTGELTAMISHRLWRSRFGADPNLPGKTIALNGREVRVTGVLPPNFEVPGLDVDIWRPTNFDPAQKLQASFRRAHWIRPVARLRVGVTAEQANAELQVVVKRLQQDYPATNDRMEGGLTPLHTFLSGDSRRPLLILLGAVGALLLIACANVGNLLLVQAAARSHETSLRIALGARRGRLVRQALTESFVIASIGGISGCILGYWSARALVALRPTGLIEGQSVSMNWTVFAYVAGITVMSSLIFGLAAVFFSAQRAPADAIRDGARGGSGQRVRRWGEVLVVSEVALALLLTLGAGLLVRSFHNLDQVDAGLRAEGVATAKISLPAIRYDSVRRVLGFWSDLMRDARDLPGVTAAGATSQLPLTSPSWSSDFTAQDWPRERFGIDVLHRDAFPGYFEAMGVPVLRGRTFAESDVFGGLPVVILNEEAARLFGDADPVGSRIAFARAPDSTATWYTIVGVVGSERQSALAAPPRPEVFQPTAQRVNGSLVVVLRTQGRPEAVIPAFRALVARHDPNLALADVRTMSEVRGEAASRERFMAILLLAFAMVGLVLAVTGVYGVMARVARGRSREMGIRVALGAQISEVRWLVVRRGLMLTAAGIAIGVAGAIASTGTLRSLLFGITPFDLPTFVIVSLVLGCAAVGACWVPATRVSRSGPMEALRADVS
jgi:putative ABC transport system permease protein